MPHLKRLRPALRVLLFVAMGLLLLATSDADYGISYSRSVEVPETVLRAGMLDQRVTFLISPQAGAVGEGRVDGPRSAELLVFFKATHSDESPQLLADNTPWVEAEILVTQGFADAGLAPLSPAATEPARFLREGGVWDSEAVVLDAEGRGRVAVQVSRAPTARDITTRLSWEVTFSAWAPADDNGNAELPWDIEVQVEAAPPVGP